jgi:hypothetical protein
VPDRVSEVDSAAQDQHAVNTQEHYGGDVRSAGRHGREGTNDGEYFSYLCPCTEYYLRRTQDKHSGQRGQKGLTGPDTTLCFPCVVGRAMSTERLSRLWAVDDTASIT